MYTRFYTNHIELHKNGLIAYITSSKVTPAELLSLPDNINVIALRPNVVIPCNVMSYISHQVKSVVFNELDENRIEPIFIDLLPHHLYVYCGSHLLRKPTFFQHILLGGEPLRANKRRHDSVPVETNTASEKGDDISPMQLN